jgi:TolB-like protein
MSRRLAAIVIADVVGFSRLMEADETATLAALRDRRKAILEPVVRGHEGRVVKLMGDGALMEFASAVKAVEAAMALQQQFARANDGLPDARRILLRIGINLGEVVGEEADIYGDGVNIASRIETLAEAGGIVVSQKVRDEIERKLPVKLHDLGHQTLKNIALPVRVYRLEVQTPSPENSPAPAAPHKRSIAVLPFTNMSADADQEFFADGLAEDLITELSKAPGLLVIARHSSFAFKNKSIDLRDVARQLGVRYVLEGSARRSGNRIRINAQLIDAQEGGGHVWAERFDRELADVFLVQDEVVAHIVEALVGRLASQKLPDRKTPRSIAAYDLCVRGRFLYHRMGGSQEGKEARQLFEQAIGLDPDYAEAHAFCAMTHWFAWVNWFEAVEPHRRRAVELGQRVVALDPNDPFARMALAFILQYEKRHAESAQEIAAALRLDPNHADT